jgi:hypothetical protein
LRFGMQAPETPNRKLRLGDTPVKARWRNALL